MGVKMTAAEKAEIKKEITGIYDKMMSTAEKVDTSTWAGLLSDDYHLGFIDSGVFVPKAQEVVDAFTEGFKHLERQEQLEDIEFRLAVLAPDVVVGTDLKKTGVYRKDGKVFIGKFAHTMVFIKVDGEWKGIHFHQSVQPVEE